MQKIYIVHSWTLKKTKKSLETPYSSVRHFFDEDSANDVFASQQSKVSFELQCGKNLKGFVVLRVVEGVKGEMGFGTEIKRIEL